MLNNKLPAASLDFSAAIVNLTQDLIANREAVIAPQLAKCGTLIGAYIYEAQFAADKDGHSIKLQSALEAAIQAGYWLELLYHNGYFSDMDFRNWAEDCDSVRSMIIDEIDFLKNEA